MFLMSSQGDGMKKLLTVIFGLLGAFVVAALVVGANYTVTQELPTDPRYVDHRSNREIAKTNKDLVGLVAAYNTLSTGTQYGYIPLPLTSWREVADASTDVGNITANGGILASDTTPILSSHTSGGTYISQKIHWAASNSDAIVTQVSLPGDFDSAAAFIVQLRIGNSGTTDEIEPVIALQFNEYATIVDGTSDSVDATTDTTFAAYDVAFSAGDATTDSQSVTIRITPNAHTTNALYMSSARIKYTRDFY